MCKHCPTPDIAPYLALAHKGAAFLDEHGPANWWDSVALNKLDLDDGIECILGQIYGEYGTGRAKLGICEDFAGTLGFATPDEGEPFDDHTEDERDRALTAAWSQIIVERRLPQVA